MKTTTPITVTREDTGKILVESPVRQERRFIHPQEAADWLEVYAAGQSVHWNLTPKQP